MKAMKSIAALIGILITLPIWFYLLYQILDRVQASELMWFLYWIYVPFTMLISAAAKLAEAAE